jgi:tetratricopeptide (TPR) repeat protein
MFKRLSILARLPRSPRIVLALLLIAAPCALQAQTKSATAPQKKNVPASAAQSGAVKAKTADEKPKSESTTRARRVGDQATAAKQPASGDAKPAAGELKSAAEEKKSAAEKTTPAPKPATPKVETPEAEVSRRRAEIADAPVDERVKLRRALVDRLVELNMKGEALEELRQMVHEDRFDPSFFYNTGNALARLGDANAAADAYRKAISQRKGNYARALNNLGVVLTRQGRWDEAYDALVGALTQENFNYAEASYNLGRLHLLRGEANLAIREWTRTLQIDPDHVEATSALARAYAEDGNEKRGLAVLANFTSRSTRVGGGVPREIAAAREEINAGIEPFEPARDAREATPQRTNNATSGVAASSTSMSSTRTVVSSRNASTRTGGRTLAVDPQTYELLQSARAAGDTGKYEEAIRRYRSVLSHNGGYFAPANLELGAALINLKRDDEAIAVLSPITERDDARYPVAHYHLARLYEQHGQLELAARHFARAAELYGDTAPQMLFDLSRLREKLNDPQGALTAMESYVTSIARQGSVPDWATARVDALRAKAKGATTAPPFANAKP